MIRSVWLLFFILFSLFKPILSLGQTVPSYISSISDYQVRALTGSFAPTNGKATIQSVTPSEWAGSEQGVIAAWSGGFYAISGTKLYVHGGGHNDSDNNGIYVYDFSGTTAPTGWTVVGQSAKAAVRVASTYTDGKPAAIHTYNGTVYATHNNTVYRFGGAPWNPVGGFYADVWKFNFTTNAWTQLPSYPYGGGFYNALYDPSTGKILISKAGDWGGAFFNTSTESWSAQKTTDSVFGDEGCSAWDPTRGRGVQVGNGGSKVLTVNWSAETVSVATLSASGDTTMLGQKGGCFYDQDRDVYWLFGGASGSPGWSNIYEMNASSFAITAHALSAPIPTTDQRGSFGRFVFLSSWRAIGIVGAYNTPAYVIKLPPASGTTPSAFDFALTNSGALSGNQGSSVTTSVSANLLSGTNQSVSFSAAGLPSGAAASFNPSTCNLPCSSNVTISTAATTPQGTYTVTITGTAGLLSRTTTSTLTVNAVTVPPPTVPIGSTTLLVKFGSNSSLNTFGLSGWSTVIKDVYTDYQNIGPGGTSIVVGDNYTYNYQGVSGVARNFIAGEKITVTWYNNSATGAIFTPNISFNDPDRIFMGAAGVWYPMTSTTVPAFGTATSEYAITPATAGSYSLVNVNVNYTNTQVIVASKIELQAVGSTTPPPTAPTVLISASPTTITSGNSSTLTWSTANATSCSASGGWSGIKGLSGSASTGSLTANTTFTLVCTGVAGSASQSATVAVSPSTPPPTSGNQVTSFRLTSTTSGTKPFTIGHAFKQGGVPSGSTVSANVTDFQAVIKNAWPDGSAKFAILSGRASLPANTPLTVTLSVASIPGGTALTESDLLNTGVTASIQYGATCTVNLSSLIGTTSTLSAGRMTAGRVRTWASGPVMSNWIYYSRCGSDAHLSVWFDVRLYSSGEVEIVPWIENATLNIASPTSKTGTATFTMNGTTRYTGSLPMAHHTRAVLASGTTLSHWSGADPAVTPKHDVTYFQSTKMVPSYYGTTAAGSALWGRVASSYTPFTEAQIPYSGMSGAGYGNWIGLIPEWEAAYLTSGGDPRAYTGSIINQYAVGGHGIYYRDETTNQPMRFSSYPNLVINSSGTTNWTSTGASSTDSYTPTPTGTLPGNWDVAHHPALGYFTYLLTGRFYFLENLQFSSAGNFIINTDTNRQFTAGIMLGHVGALTLRGAAWALRDLAMAAAVTPDGETLRTEFLNSYASNINYYHTIYVAQPNNTQGHVEPYDKYDQPTSTWRHSTFMDDFFTMSVGMGLDIVTGLSGTNQTKLSTFFAWKALAVIGRLGGTGATEFYFADAANSYTLPWSPSNSANFSSGTGPWYATWGAVYDAEYGSPHPRLPVDGNLRGGYFPDGTSFWGNLQPAIAYAVSHGVTGALAGYNRMIGAGNWSSILATWNNDPIWGVKPTTLSPGTPPSPGDSAPSAPTGLSLK